MDNLSNIATRYKIDRKIGEGASGDVYKAWDEYLERWVAIKILPEESANIKEARERFLREAKALASCDQHPGIVRIYDVFPTGAQPYIVMELLKGDTLTTNIINIDSIARRIDVLRQISSAIDHAHARNIVHRDLNPNNIIIDDHDNIKVIDFGWMKNTKELSITQANLGGIGTLNYISPEQMRSAANVDHRTDIYSFGCIIYFVFEGNAPGPSATLKLPNADWANSIRTLYERCIESDPERRPQTMREAMLILESIQAALKTGKYCIPLGVAPIPVPVGLAFYLKGQRIRDLTRANVQIILDHVRSRDMRDYIYFLILATTGIRHAEVLHLHCLDVHDGYITYLQRKVSRRSIRKVAVNSEVNNILHEWTKGKSKADWLFPGSAMECVINRRSGEIDRICEGGHASSRNIQRRWKMHLKEVGLWKPGRGVDCLRGYAIGEFYRSHNLLDPHESSL